MLNTQEKRKFDFDMWSELSQNDPDAFEKLREQTVSQHIGSMDRGRQDRLRCLQWKVDRVREQQKTPIAACVAISDMMWDSLERLNKIYYDYDGVTSLKEGRRVLTPLPKAVVLPFVSQ